MTVTPRERQATGTATGILDTVGHTPLVELTSLLPNFRGSIYGKLELLNPGGSIKDRSAVGMLRGMLESGELIPGRSVIVESSSGNMAVGLAQFCRYHDLRLICVVDSRTTQQNRSVLRAYGIELEVVTVPDADSGGLLQARKKRVREIVESVPYAYSPDQYANPLNPKTHESTMAEIAAALDNRVDYLFAPTGTTGTLNGCAAYVDAAGLDTVLVAVDAIGSVLYGLPPAPRLIPGHGAADRPAILDRSIPDRVVHVTDLDCVVGCRKLIDREAILAGGSSGAAVSALEWMADQIPAGARCVLIFPDRGDRYLDTIYSDEWVEEHFGQVGHLWRRDAARTPRLPEFDAVPAGLPTAQPDFSPEPGFADQATITHIGRA